MRVHIHANCQAIPIRGMLNEAYPDWDISFFEIHAQPIVEQLDRYYECVRTADIVLSQPVHDGYRDRHDFSIDWVRANLRPGAALVVFPSMHFAAHQASWESHPSPGFDLLAAHLIACGLGPDEALRRLLSPDLLSDEDIDREIDVTIDETRRREISDSIDVKLSHFLDQHCRTKLIFHINNHPMREAAVFVTNAILAQLGLANRVAVAGHDYQSETHMPPLPAVTRFLTARGGVEADPAVYDTVRLHPFADMTIETYYRQMVETLALRPADELSETIASRWPTIQVLRRLASHNTSIPGIERWAA